MEPGQMLDSSEGRALAVAVENAPVGIMLCEADGGCAVANLRLCGLLGVDRETCLGYGWIDAIDPRDRARVRGEWNLMPAGDQRFMVEFRVVRPDGAALWVLASGQQADGRSVDDGLVVSFTDVSALKAGQEAWRHRHARVQAVLDHLPAGVVLRDLDGRLDYVNLYAASVEGLTPDILLGHGCDQPDLTQAVKPSRSEDGAVPSAEDASTLVVGGGDPRYQVVRYPVRDEHGQTVAVGAVALDVSEGMGAAEVSDRLAAIVNSSDDAIIGKTLDGQILSWNPAAERIYGYTAAEAVGRPISMLVATGQHDELDGMLARLVAGESVGHFETIRRRKDGREIDVSLTLSPVHDHAGAIVGASTIARDITERRRSEDALRLHAELLDLAHGAVIVRDPVNRVTSWNREAIAVYGYSAADAVGQITHELLKTAFPETREAVEGALARDGHWQGELRHTRKDGAVIVVSSRQALQRDSDGRPIAIVELNSDITERQRIADELSVAHDRAVEASRLKSVFVANMSHEIRTPLNGVIGMAGLLADTGLDAEQREYVDAVRTSGDALMAVIEDILDFSKIEAGKLELDQRPFDVRELVEGACTMLAAPASSKGVELMSWLDDGIWETVYGDGPRLRQVLVNLLTNAVKFTAAGEVVVHVSEHRDGPRPGLRFEVSDTGIGIDATATGQIFDSFTQADNTTTRRYGGTGLGLAISKRLVELMGGQIGVHSTPGEGSTFWFTIAVDAAPSEPAPTAPTSVATVRALIVDDNLTNRMILEHQLGSWDMACTIAADARAALVMLRAAAQSGRPYGLVVLDARMPHMNGLQLAVEIRSDRSLDGIKLVMLTSSGAGRAAATQAGIDGFVTKPVRQGRLRDEITRVLGLTAPGHGPDSHRQFSGERVDFSDLVRQPSVLVAEDVPVNQIVARRLLEKRGLRVDIAADGLQALERHAGLAYDLILMDCQMPALDGYQASREIRRREGTDRHTPIIAMTAHTLTSDRERCLDAGMDDYLAKPLALDLLDEILSRTLRPGDSPSGMDSASPVTQDNDPGQEIAVFDPSCLAEICEGDQDIHRDLAATFRAQVDAAIGEMCRALDGGDLQAVGRTAHALTGSSGLLGANRLSALTRRITDDITTGNPIEAPATRAQLTRVHAQTIAAFTNPDAD
jgi:two-component system sensor histidine kinase/response regulator